jgi:hypothetical protein
MNIFVVEIMPKPTGIHSPVLNTPRHTFGDRDSKQSHTITDGSFTANAFRSSFIEEEDENYQPRLVSVDFAIINPLQDQIFTHADSVHDGFSTSNASTLPQDLF